MSSLAGERVVLEPEAVPTRRGVARRRVTQDKVLLLSGSVCFLIILLGIVGPLVAPNNPLQTDILAANEGPSSEHLFGTDQLGRDLFSRILAGARLSLLGPALVVAASTVLGTSLAMVSAWFGRGTDRSIARVLDVLFAFPGLLFAILTVAVFGQGFWAPVVALSIAYMPYMARVSRSVAVRERNLPYVEACQLAGMSSFRICLRHLLPNLSPIILAQATLAFGAALLDLSAISFLGLGVQPPSQEWGLIVSEGRVNLLNGWPQEALFAGGMIAITVVAFNVLGERLSDISEGRR